MDPPVPAPRSGRVKNTGARAKERNGLGPPKDFEEQKPSAPLPPIRKKKKEAPSPPSASLLHSSSSISSLPKNSTMMSSSSSLPGLRDDMSPIRPASSMSNISVSSVRSHKKRRAPPPPVQLSVKPIPEENSPEKTVQRVPSPTPSNASIIPDIEAVQGDTAEETLQHESPGLTENPQLEDKKQMYAKVNKVKTNEVIHDDNYNSISVKEEYEIHESVIICDENETDNHVYETVEIKKELNTNEDLVIKEEYEQETRLNEFDAPEDTEKREKKKKKKKSKDINEYDQDEAHNMDGEAILKKKKKKKDKERDRSLDNDDEH